MTTNAQTPIVARTKTVSGNKTQIYIWAPTVAEVKAWQNFFANFGGSIPNEIKAHESIKESLMRHGYECRFTTAIAKVLKAFEFSAEMNNEALRKQFKGQKGGFKTAIEQLAIDRYNAMPVVDFELETFEGGSTEEGHGLGVGRFDRAYAASE